MMRDPESITITVPAAGARVAADRLFESVRAGEASPLAEEVAGALHTAGWAAAGVGEASAIPTLGDLEVCERTLDWLATIAGEAETEITDALRLAASVAAATRHNS